MRRIQKQLGMLFVFLCTVILTGCNDEESNPLRFDQSVDEDNTVDVCFPRSEEDGSAGAVTILGGDGNYTAQCDNAAVLKIDMKYPNAFVLYPQDWGEAHVTVTDGTGASIVLKVVVFQSKQTLAIDRLDVLITGGDQLTEEQLEKLREEALATVPVKQAGGGYRMIFDNPQDSYSGTLCFYPTEMDKEEEMVKGTFIVNSDRNEENLWNYRFQLEEKEHTLVFVPYSDKKTVTKADVLPTVALLEDVTGQIPTSYPGVEVFTQQVIQRP
jgi:hypothetical protein